ncbi:MAG: hypothetical protein ACRD2U_17965 [Terriglobales bacterium]
MITKVTQSATYRNVFAAVTEVSQDSQFLLRLQFLLDTLEGGASARARGHA